MLLFHLCYFQGYPFYKLNQERIEVVFQNATSLKVTYAEIHKINKTLTGLNFAVQIDDVSRANEYWVCILFTVHNFEVNLGLLIAILGKLQSFFLPLNIRLKIEVCW